MPLHSINPVSPQTGKRRSKHLAAGVLSAVALAALAAPAVAQLDDETYAAAEDVILAYAADMTKAMPCIYISGAVIQNGEDRFDVVFGRAAVVEALDDFDALSSDQAAALTELFDETYAPVYAVDDVRELAVSCFVTEGDEQPIIMQLRLFTGVSVPLSVRLDRAID